MLLFVFIRFVLSSFLSGICGAKFSKILQDLKDVRGAEEKACEARTASKTLRRSGGHVRGFLWKPLAMSIQFSSVTQKSIEIENSSHTSRSKHYLYCTIVGPECHRQLRMDGLRLKQKRHG